ncbi:uncharacterized protein LOC119560657 [Drosophila subpulchrella]|uniref:uncharacterized protein LOC119560657 n=1 Tax=Drosophila subpulchrella TaxID=1486046 RepID=UPI0018A1326C|nr:uncharacterized protein LOC119560657 [Drosophila subpulchrella]
MVNYLGNGLVTYGLFLSLPVRMLMYAVFIYLANVAALLQLIQELLILMLQLQLVAIRYMYHPRPFVGTPFRESLLDTMQFLMSGWSLLLHLLAQSLSVPCAVLGRLSRVFRICARSRTWATMLQTN